MLLFVGKQTGLSGVYLEELRGVGLVTGPAVTLQMKRSEGGTTEGAGTFVDLYVEFCVSEAKQDFT